MEQVNSDLLREVGKGWEVPNENWETALKGCVRQTVWILVPLQKPLGTLAESHLKEVSRPFPPTRPGRRVSGDGALSRQSPGPRGAGLPAEQAGPGV